MGKRVHRHDYLIYTLTPSIVHCFRLLFSFFGNLPSMQEPVHSRSLGDEGAVTDLQRLPLSEVNDFACTLLCSCCQINVVALCTS